MSEFGPGDTPRDPDAFTTIQFLVSKTLEHVLDAKAIRAAAHASGLQEIDSIYEWSTVGTPAGKARITCASALAPCLIDAFLQIAATSSADVRDAATDAATAGLDALTPWAR